jgi:hypothetical protein
MFSLYTFVYMRAERKVQGAQWYITLPSDWRDSGGHDIKKGDTLIAHFEPDSVMILNPQVRQLSDLEGKLINILTNLPRLIDTRELIENLREIVAGLDTA